MRRPSRACLLQPASTSAQDLATAVTCSGFAGPGIVAQLPFSTNSPRDHESAFLSAVLFAGKSTACWNLSTQIGVRTFTTATFAPCNASVCARFEVTQLPQ
jgi:hypothetical protein